MNEWVNEWIKQLNNDNAPTTDPLFNEQLHIDRQLMQMP